MLSFSRRLIYALSNKILQISQEKKLVVDFARAKKSPFDIKSEFSHNAYMSNGSLALGLKKSNYIAWVDIPGQEYRDHIIKAKIRLDSLGGYASTGIIFHIMDQDSFYLALVSSKGYFRLDVINDNVPKALIAWTEIPDFDGNNIKLNIITCGAYLTLLINGKWVGETNDDSINSGRLGFVLASYETASHEAAVEDKTVMEPADMEYTCEAWLDYLSVDTRTKTINAEFKKWTDDLNINAESRLRLAETFAVMGESSKAMYQVDKAWKRRHEAIQNISATSVEVRTKRELLLAARMSFRLGQYNEAEGYIDEILEHWPNSGEGKAAYTEKLKILNELNKFTELKEFMLKYTDQISKDIDYYALLARCHWELKEYMDSAKAWDKAFEMNSENGVYAVNAASALELAEKKKEALERFLEAGKIFLKQDNKPELAAMMPKLAVLGEKNWEARALAGKWAFSIEDYDKCVTEFTAADKLMSALKPKPKADPEIFYLWGLVLSLKGKNKDAIRLLERAVKLAPAFGLFRFKLAEIKLTSGVKGQNPAEELKLALKHIDDPDGGMANNAGNLLLDAGYAKQAKYFFDKAKKK